MSLGAARLILGLLLTVPAGVGGQETAPVAAFDDAATASHPADPGAPAGPTAAEANQALVPDLDNGATIYDNACAACHGETGEGRQGSGAALRYLRLNLSETIQVIRDGRNTMPAFDVLTAQQLLDISTFVKEAL